MFLPLYGNTVVFFCLLFYIWICCHNDLLLFLLAIVAVVVCWCCDFRQQEKKNRNQPPESVAQALSLLKHENAISLQLFCPFANNRPTQQQLRVVSNISFDGGCHELWQFNQTEKNTRIHSQHLQCHKMWNKQKPEFHYDFDLHFIIIKQ